MTKNVTVERIFEADIETIYGFLTKPEKQALWWGPPGTTITTHDLDFMSEGSWFVKMEGSDNSKFHISGVVTSSEPPNRVEFTWGWHDGDGKRGNESHVIFSLEAVEANKTRFTVTHIGLENEQAIIGHEKGWNANLDKLKIALN
jgi:uncharacterized protein YndB with AHSA1/START domain